MASSPPNPAEALLRHLDWTVLKRLDGLLQGDVRTLAYGRGLDFADLRDYEPTDDVRHIDWNATARFNRPHVRQFLEDRDHTAWFLVDRSASMAFGPDGRTKADVLAEFVSSMAMLLTRAGNRVGAVLWNNRHDLTVPPGRSRNQVLRLADALLAPPLDADGPTDLGGLVELGRRTVQRRSLVFVVSDFISEPGWEDELGALAHRHDVVAIRLVDPTEIELPGAGVIVLEDPETGEQLEIDTDDPGFRARFATAARTRADDLDAAIRGAGGDAYAVSTDDDLVESIAAIADRRRRRSTA
ncbi:MAG: DUF58 domain-containing protein [Actinomycetota bacterium]